MLPFQRPCTDSVFIPFFLLYSCGSYRDTLFSHDGPHRRERAFVHRSMDIVMGQRVRQGMDLELESDLHDVERCDTEPDIQSVS